ncbi:MAG TPA: outer membrane protein assembly factor BamA [Bdellovibrionales bacterium]|nr:MAG: outer membrane protein assembly factor BamA [Bdellovibrionales bacterium GWB1_52_6]OFZ03667.1 MAG: outer membrane protein assembly factor BamA [Bdellovibrionales bacterium GWA1_52_35]OFZ42552.1 MAG: outer membrane protein assembly factor BamA [Bdellovibrionales bacterium GWC1_52_8]HAR44301.1 outer membrane protein assembly factor BamA [Bdellovibrionales bacterium]HCM40608.1 outer membrane protein assembly factor BamA [Bdellovibrionales bacterium]
MVVISDSRLHRIFNFFQSNSLPFIRAIAVSILLATVTLQAAPPVATSWAGKVVSGVEFRGLKRIEKDAVLVKLVTKPGQPVTAEQVRADIQSLFAMGYFDDIEVVAESTDAGHVNLIYSVRERPVIGKIEFEGNEKITTTDLREVIKLREWAILDINKVKDDAALLQKHYEEKGFYLAKVTFDIKQTASGEVELTYHVSDYDKVQIKKITFLNNRRFSDEQLKGLLMETREGGLMSFLSSSGNFKESAFKQDLQRLTYWYLDHGYVKFRYENPVVTVSDDKRWLFISIYVDEGDAYSIGTLDFGGDLLFPKNELHADLTMKEAENFSISKRNADIQRLTEKYQDLGYAFVNVIPNWVFHDDQKTVDIQYSFEKGSLVYFGEVNILGNSKTHDKVIRRELKIVEGSLYSGTRLRQSKENVERLGYFAPGEVIFNTVTPKGKPDILDVEITVKERSTGTITLGAGYGSIQKFFFTTQVAEINLMGRGQTVSLSAQYAADRLSKSFNFGFTDPYAFDTRWSTGFDAYYVNFPIPNQYLTRKLGFDLRFGYPLAEFVNGYITYKNEGLQIEPTSVDFDEERGRLDSGILSSVVWSVVRDKRNNRFETTAGNFQSFSLETAGLGGDKKFFKWILNNRYYKRLVGDLVFRNNFEVGQVSGIGDRPIPPSERFYLGGPNSLKGYATFLLGPSTTDGKGIIRPIGGTFEMLSLFELEYPLIREAGLKWVLFYDVGNSFETFPTSEYFSLRSDWGFGIRWFSPIGPLRFEWGFPIKQKPGESGSQFQFFIGPPF